MPLAPCNRCPSLVSHLPSVASVTKAMRLMWKEGARQHAWQHVIFRGMMQKLSKLSPQHC